jgi:hypothetical protein
MLEQILGNNSLGQKLETRLNGEYKLQNKENETVSHIKIINILSNPLRDSVVLYEIEETKDGIKEVKKIIKEDLLKILKSESWLSI